VTEPRGRAGSAALIVLTAGASALARGRDLDQALRELLGAAVDATGADQVALFAQNPDRAALELVIAFGLPDEALARLSAAVAHPDHPLAAAAASRSAAIGRADAGDAGVTHVDIPLVVARSGIEEGVGVVSFGWSADRPDDAETRELLQAAADLAAVAVERARLVSTADPQDRARCFITPSSGRNINSQVRGRTRIVDEPIGAGPPPIARYGFRSFDRQWAFDDPRMAKTESPSLWAAVSDEQIFMTSMLTLALAEGLAASVTTHVPDLHHFNGRGGKDIIPLYRDAKGTPNADPKLLSAVGRYLGDDEPLSVEDLFAYSYALLAGADYSSRFAEELRTPGPRVPLTADSALFEEAAEYGRELLWLHTYGERFAAERGPLLVPSIVVQDQLTLPERPSDIRYDAPTQSLTVGSGVVVGVTPEVWAFEVSGMPVVKKWLGYRTAKGAGRAASSTSPLDYIRPTEWPEEWTSELRELLSVLQRTVDLQPEGAELLDRILEGPLIDASDLPEPPPELRQPPGSSRGPKQSTLGL